MNPNLNPLGLTKKDVAIGAAAGVVAAAAGMAISHAVFGKDAAPEEACCEDEGAGLLNGDDDEGDDDVEGDSTPLEGGQLPPDWVAQYTPPMPGEEVGELDTVERKDLFDSIPAAPPEATFAPEVLQTDTDGAIG